jgi:hypothetical protein
MPRCAWRTTPQVWVSPLVRVLCRRGAGGHWSPAKDLQCTHGRALQAHDAPSRNGL